MLSFKKFIKKQRELQVLELSREIHWLTHMINSAGINDYDLRTKRARLDVERRRLIKLLEGKK